MRDAKCAGCGETWGSHLEGTNACRNGSGVFVEKRCPACAAGLADSECACAPACSQKEGSRSGVESAGDALRDARPDFRQKLGYFKTYVSAASDVDIILEVWIVNNYAHLPSQLEGQLDAALEAEVSRTVSLEAQLADLSQKFDDGHEWGRNWKIAAETAEARNGKLVEALTRIRHETRRQQLPITAEIHEIAEKALEDLKC